VKQLLRPERVNACTIGDRRSAAATTRRPGELEDVRDDGRYGWMWCRYCYASGRTVTSYENVGGRITVQALCAVCGASLAGYCRDAVVCRKPACRKAIQRQAASS
jgi:hypothetical protein